MHQWDEAEVLEQIRRRAVAGKRINAKEIRRDDRPLLDAAIRYYTGWQEALEAGARKWPQIKAITEAADAHGGNNVVVEGEGAKLRAARLRARLSQRALGELSGDKQSDISNMESGRVGVQPRVWQALGLEGAPAEAPPPAVALRVGRPPRPDPTRKVQIVLTAAAWSVWERWVADGLGSASERVSALIEAEGED